MGSALAGIVAVGILLAAVGFIVQFAGIGWIDRLMPPVVAGSIVALIGFNLAPVAWTNFRQAPVTASITLIAVILFSVIFRGFLGRISIFLGVIVGYLVAVIAGQVDFSAVEKAAWVGLPEFQVADFGSAGTWSVIAMFLPVVLVLIAENVGHVRGVATMTDASVNKHTGRALIADGARDDPCRPLRRFGHHHVRREHRRHGRHAGLLDRCVLGGRCRRHRCSRSRPKSAPCSTPIPPGVLGGVTTALYGLIGIIGIKIWVDNRVDFSRPVNQYTGAVSLVIAVAGFTMQWGDFQLGAIVIGAAAALLIYHVGNAIARWRQTGADDGGPIPAVGPLGGDHADGPE